MRLGDRRLSVRYRRCSRNAAPIAAWVMPVGRSRRDGAFLRWRGFMVLALWRGARSTRSRSSGPGTTKAAPGAAVGADPGGLDPT